MTVLAGELALLIPARQTVSDLHRFTGCKQASRALPTQGATVRQQRRHPLQQPVRRRPTITKQT